MIYWFAIASIALFAVACCIAQHEPSRQHAAYVYGAGCVAHVLLFEGLRIYGVDYHWSLYYVTAGVIGLFVIIGLQNLPEYTTFNFRLQLIALASIVINMFGGMGEYANMGIGYYTFASFSLYLVLIRELLINGQHRRSTRDSGLFKRLRWPTS